MKQGSSDYNVIVANAMEATDNLLTLKDAQGTSSQPVKPIQNKTVGKVGQSQKVAGANNRYNNADAIFSIIDKFVNKGGKATSHPLCFAH